MHNLDRLLPTRRGHFLLESGHHGDLWLDLEMLFARPKSVRPFAAELAGRIANRDLQAVCGPLVEGAFVGLMVAEALGLPFSYAVPSPPDGSELYPVEYRIPAVQRADLRGRRVAIVNDVVNAGSAVLGTLKDLRACASEPIVVASLAVLGDAARRLVAEEDLELEALSELPNTIWTPGDCPLCQAGTPLTEATGS